MSSWTTWEKSSQKLAASSKAAARSPADRSGARHERTIAAVSGWQTQVFLFMSDYDGVLCADLVRGAVLMSQAIGFNPSDTGLRLIELARIPRSTLESMVQQMATLN